MKRKLCSVLLALCMVLTLLPVSAMADVGTPAEAPAGESTPTEAPAASNVAKIGDKEYATLAKAVEAAESGATITLLSDVTASTTIPAGKTITLDLNSKTLKAQTQVFDVYGNLTIKNGKVEVTDDAEAAAIWLNKTAKLTIESDAIVSVPTSNFAIAFYSDCTAAELTVKGTLKGGNGLTVNGNIANPGNKVTVDGATIESEGHGIYQAGVSDIVVKNANITGSTAIEVRAGSMTIESGTFTATAAEYTCNPNGNGTTTEGAALAIAQHTTKKDISVTVNGGTFKGIKALNESNPQNNDPAPQVDLKVVGGTFNGDVSITDNGNTSITGGTFSDLSALGYLADGAKVTVKLAANTTKDVTIPAGTTVTLDLNGYKLTNASQDTIINNGTLTVIDSLGGGKVDNTTHGKAAIYNKGTVTLNAGTFERSAEAGVDKDNNGGNSFYTILNHGKMTVASGVTVNNNGHYSSLFENGYYDYKNKDGIANPELTINGGTFDGGLNTIKNDDDAVLTINGGTFTNYTQAAFQNHGTATVNGGTFTADSWYSIDNCGCDATHDPGKLTITNGTFTGTLYVRSQFSDVSISGGTFTGNITKTGGSLSLTGGTYSVNPTAYVADTHIARKDGDAQYTVVAKSNLTAGVYTSNPADFLAPGYVSYKNSDDTYTVYYPVPVTPGNTSSSTTKNPDGSTTTTTTDKTTGTVTETTKNPDGSTTTVETKKDGSVTETNKTANGSVGTVKSDANGNTEISANISAADVSAAAKKNEPVAAPVSVAPAASPAAAPVIKLSVPASAGEVSVVIPVTNAQQGTVAIKVNPDGTEEIIKTSVVTKDGVVLGVKGSTQIKIVNNDKDFSDTVGHWAESDVDFVSARELFTGTAPQTFSPESATTRGMVVTVLARLAGESTDGGANWYDKGCAWAVTNGVSDGTDPNGTVTREQLAAMLYRYFGSPAVSGSLSFADASSVSEYAHDAMQWCVNNGIINGMDGLLNPQGQATRAQVSAMFARYIHLAATK